jgi:hypothetical protein
LVYYWYIFSLFLVFLLLFISYLVEEEEEELPFFFIYVIIIYIQERRFQMEQLVKYSSRDGKYVNLGIRLSNGFIIPIRSVVKKHYYQLRDKALEVKIETQKKGE